MRLFHIAFFSLMLFLGLAGAAPAADDDVSGLYRGTLDTGTDTEVLTIFTVTPGGEMSGVYSYRVGEAGVPGVLQDCFFEVRLLRCVWRDMYGEGDFIVLFAPDYRSFEGSWFEDRRKVTRMPDAGYRWSGKRTE